MFAPMSRWWQSKRFHAARASRRRRLWLEVLEDRALPSIAGSFPGAVALGVGANVNLSKLIDNQMETTIAVDPNNPDRIFAASNMDGNGVGSPSTTINALFTAYSTDGGQTWTSQVLFGSGSAQACCDPNATFDQFGNLFLTYINNPNDDIILATSTDGGQSFTTTQLTSNHNNDQPKVAVGPGYVAGSGSVWVTYTDASFAIKAQGALVTGLGTVGSFGAAELATNSNVTGGDFGGIAVGPNGQVMVDYQTGQNGAGPDTIFVNIDADGLGALGFGPQITASATNVGGARIIPATSNNFGIDAEAKLAWDRSGGPHNGRVYLVYTDAANTTTNDTDIFARFSDDNGATWSTRVRVNDDAGTNSQFNPSINVDQSTGAVGIAWYDSRNDTGVVGSGSTNATPNDDAQNFGTVSIDGGSTFAANVQLSTGTSNAAGSEPPSASNRPLGYGDFNLSTYADGTFYRLWADNSNSTGDNPDGALKKLDVYTARVTVGGETATATGGAGNDDYTLRLDPTGQFVDFYENTSTAGTPTFIAALGALKNIVINGNGGNNTLTIDVKNGNPIPTGGLSFDGGSGTATLTVQGGAVTNITENLVGPAAANLSLSAGGPARNITATNLALAQFNPASLASLSLNLPAGTTAASLADDTVSGNNVSQLSSSDSTFPTTRFLDPTSPLQVNFGTGAAVTVNALDTQYSTGLTLADSGAGGDTVTFAGSLSITGSLSVTAGTININSAITTGAGSQAYHGAVTFNASTTALTASTASFFNQLNLGTNTVNVTGNFQLATASVNTTLAGSQASQYGHVTYTGSASLGSATLNVTLAGGFTPARGTPFDLVGTSGGTAVTGTFNSQLEGSIYIDGQGHRFFVTYNGGASQTDAVLTFASGKPSQTAVEGTLPSQVAGQAFALKADIQDSAGNVVPDSTATVTLFIANSPDNVNGSGPHAVVTQGNLTASAVNGVATFSNLALALAGPYVIFAQAGALDELGTNVFQVTAATASALAFERFPADTTAGLALGAVNVDVVDAFGNLVSGSAAQVTIAATGPSTFSAGTTTVAAAGGIASFSGLTLPAAGSYTLTVSSTGLGPVTTGSFTVAPTSNPIPLTRWTNAGPNDIPGIFNILTPRAARRLRRRRAGAGPRPEQCGRPLCRHRQRRHLEDQQRHCCPPALGAADRRAAGAVDRRPQARPDRRDAPDAPRRHRRRQQPRAHPRVLDRPPAQHRRRRHLGPAGRGVARRHRGSRRAGARQHAAGRRRRGRLHRAGQRRRRALPQHRRWADLHPPLGQRHQRPAHRGRLRHRGRPRQPGALLRRRAWPGGLPLRRRRRHLGQRHQCRHRHGGAGQQHQPPELQHQACRRPRQRCPRRRRRLARHGARHHPGQHCLLGRRAQRRIRLE